MATLTPAQLYELNDKDLYDLGYNTLSEAQRRLAPFGKTKMQRDKAETTLRAYAELAAAVFPETPARLPAEDEQPLVPAWRRNGSHA